MVQTLAIYMGWIDAVLIMIGGIVAAFVILMGWDAQKLWERIFPALAVVIGSNIAAVIVLAVMEWIS